VKEAAEKAKRELSFTMETEINLPFISSDKASSKHIRKVLSRQTLEAMTGDLVERTVPRIEQALADARLSPDRIAHVILVGGQTRMPLVRQRVTEFFGRKPEEHVNPDEIVAMGAAIQSGILDGQIRDLVLLLDVTPFALGIETEGDGYERVIERNMTLPTHKVKAFTTVEHNQRRVRIHVLQGEGFLASMNKSLAVFELVGIEPAPAGVPQIDVTFEINADGLARVSAKDKETGLEQKVEVRPSSGLMPTEVEEIRRRQTGRGVAKLGPNG
jgi:molecular chaperone DnaK